MSVVPTTSPGARMAFRVDGEARAVIARRRVVKRAVGLYILKVVVSKNGLWF